MKGYIIKNVALFAVASFVLLLTSKYIDVFFIWVYITAFVAFNCISNIVYLNVFKSKVKKLSCKVKKDLFYGISDSFSYNSFIQTVLEKKDKIRTMPELTMYDIATHTLYIDSSLAYEKEDKIIDTLYTVYTEAILKYIMLDLAESMHFEDAVRALKKVIRHIKNKKVRKIALNHLNSLLKY